MTVEVGNVYPAQGGGGPHRPKYWLVVSIVGERTDFLRGEKAVLLGLQEDGTIVSSACYGVHAMEHRPLKGFIDLSKVSFTDL